VFKELKVRQDYKVQQDQQDLRVILKVLKVLQDYKVRQDQQVLLVE